MLNNNVMVLSSRIAEIENLPIAKLSDEEKAMFVVMGDIVAKKVKEAKSMLYKSNKPKIAGAGYEFTISTPHEPQLKAQIEVDWEKIIKYGQYNGLDIPMKVDLDALAKFDWVIELSQSGDYLKTVMVKGKAFTGSVKYKKIGE